MMKPLRNILTITPFLLFATAYIVELSEFGRYWRGVWKYFSLEQIGLVVLINIAAGLFVALFLFRKQPYKRRISLTVPIAVILFSLSNLYQTIAYEYGFDEEYNSYAAQRDIKHGKVQILSTGLPVEAHSAEYEKAQEEIEKQFGYKSVWLGCSWTPGIAKYNETVEEYLNERNGIGWRSKWQQKLDSLRKTEVPH